MYNTYGEDIAVNTPDHKKVALPLIKKVATAATKWPHFVGAGFDLDLLLQKHTSRLGRMFSRCAAVAKAMSRSTTFEDSPENWLSKKTKDGGLETRVLNKTGRRLKDFTALNRKQPPLCPEHHSQFEKGIFSDLDVEYVEQRNKLAAVSVHHAPSGPYPPDKKRNKHANTQNSTKRNPSTLPYLPTVGKIAKKRIAHK